MHVAHLTLLKREKTFLQWYSFALIQPVWSVQHCKEDSLICLSSHLENLGNWKHLWIMNIRMVQIFCQIFSRFSDDVQMLSKGACNSLKKDSGFVFALCIVTVSPPCIHRICITWDSIHMARGPVLLQKRGVRERQFTVCIPPPPKNQERNKQKKHWKDKRKKMQACQQSTYGGVNCTGCPKNFYTQQYIYIFLTKCLPEFFIFILYYMYIFR